MDFFAHQDQARSQTKMLLLFFALGLMATIVAIYAALSVTMVESGQMDFWQLDRFALVAVGVTTVVALGSLHKAWQLSSGGRAVAESLGGRLLDPATMQPNERKILNVVEEMAIASGVPTPQVYLMEESGINAFAAGYEPGDAVIGVTRGCVDLLTRDQLQGVMAHEFSHILNGDMRLNIRLMAILAGLLLLGNIGYMLLRGGMYSSGFRRRSRKESGGGIVVLAIVLMAAGYIGTFFGSLIRAAVSRQREFLADASAVQFTRNPDGIAGALKAIGAHAHGSTIEHPRAPEAGHMFFGQGVRSSFTTLFATHPPLGERIRRIDPSWEGSIATGPPSPPSSASPVSGFATSTTPNKAQIDGAHAFLSHLPESIRSSAREAYGARAVIYCLLTSDVQGVASAQMEQLKRKADPHVYEETLKLLPQLKSAGLQARLPLIDLSLPALRTLSLQQYQQFRSNCETLIQADQQVSLFEWMMLKVLTHNLDVAFQLANTPRMYCRQIEKVNEECALLLSTLAYLGHDEAAAQEAFRQASTLLSTDNLEILPLSRCRLEHMDEAIDRLSALTPPLKKSLLQACSQIITYGGEPHQEEKVLFRAITEALGCPAPQL